MDKRRLDQTGGRRSTNGPSAPGPRGDIKKANNHEESYFEGTGGAKTKRGRKPRPEVGPLPGFTLSAGSSYRSGPPPVNAWSQKKGSDLFEKGGDEYDQLLQRVKMESMKTLEEDRRRQRERMLMMNQQVPFMFDEDSKVEAEAEEQGSSSFDSCKTSSPNPYASPPYTSDSGEEYPEKDTWVPQEPTKSTTSPTPHEQKSSTEETFYTGQTPYKRRERVPEKSSHNNYSGFSKTDSCDYPRGASANALRDNDRAYNKEMFPNSFEQVSEMPQRQTSMESSMIPEVEESGTQDDELAEHLKSTLTFGNTQGLLENLNKGQPNVQPPVYDDVDLFLHQVIRHEPPRVMRHTAQVELDGIFQLEDGPKVPGTSSNPLEFVNINRQASSPQYSETSSSPYGSVGKHSCNYEQSPQNSPPAYQMPHPFVQTGAPRDMNLINQNIMVHMAAAHMRGYLPPAAAVPGMIPVPTNPVPGLPFLSPVAPTIPGQDLTNPLYQQMLMNQYYSQMALMQRQTAVTSEFQNDHAQNYQNQKVPQISESNSGAQNYPMNQNQLNQNQQIPEYNSIPQNYPANQNQKISGTSGSALTMQNYPMNQSQPILPMPLNSSIMQNYPGNQNQKIPEMSGNTPTMQNFPMNQSQQIPEHSLILQKYPGNQNQKFPEMSESTPTMQDYPINQNQQIPEHSSILQKYPSNQNQKIPEMSGITPTMQNYPINQNQQIPEMSGGTPTMQNYPINQNQQIPPMPQNSSNLQNYPGNQNQKISGNIPTMQNYQQIPLMPESNSILHNYPTSQNQQIPQNPPAHQNYPITQNQQIPNNTLNHQNYPMTQNQQIPINPLNHQNYLFNHNQPNPQMPPYQPLLMQAPPQIVPNADPENAIQPNQLPMNNVNAVPQQGVGKNQEELMMELRQAMETVNKLCREMGGQMPGYYPTMLHYPQFQIEQPPAQMQTPPVSGSPACESYESESRDQDLRTPPSHPQSPLPDVMASGRGQGHRP